MAKLSSAAASLAMFVLAAGTAATSLADDRRARVNYMLQCQGCHLPGAEGAQGAVPRLKNFMGYFLHDQVGREFIVRVPGVATSSLKNDELADLLNWMLETYSAEQLPKVFEPYTTQEVAALRKTPDSDPLKHRVDILDELAKKVPSLAVELDAGDYAY